MGRPRKSAENADTAEALLVTAEAVFASRGFDAARLEDIAAGVGLTRPSLLHHFATKEALYSSVVDRLVGRIRHALLGGMSSPGTFEERLGAMVGGFVDAMLRDPAPAMVLMRELLTESERRTTLVRDQLEPLIDLAASFIRDQGRGQLRAGVDVRATIVDLLGGVVFAVVSRPVDTTLLGRAVSPAARRAHFVALSRTLLLAAPSAS